MITTPLHCPFCGGPPEVERQEVRQGYTAAWTFIQCKFRCKVGPMVSGQSDTVYSSYNGVGQWKWVVLRTPEEALEISYQEALAAWNTRSEARR